jgi:AraC-like DNA-binding protein
MLLALIIPLLNLVILLGALQGFIFCVLLFGSARRRPANRYLAWLLLLASLASLKLWMYTKGWFTGPAMAFVDAFVPMIVAMPMGPLIYFYVKTTLHPDFRFSRRDRRHFYPVIIDLVPQLTAILFVILVLTRMIKNHPGPWGLFIDAYNVYADIPRWISITSYLWLAWREIVAARNPGRRIVSNNWLEQLIRVFLVFQALWLVYLVPYVIPKYTDFMLGHFNWYPVYVPLALLIYFLGIKGYIVAQTAKVSPNTPVPDRDLAEQTAAALRIAMEKERLYLDPALTVAVVAEHTHLPPKQISAVLNQHLQKSFNEFINEYRIRAIRERLLNGDTENLTIAAIAYEGGFNSLPTFQRAFKTMVGQTPSEFLAAAKEKV